MKILYVTTISATLNSFFIQHIRRLVQEGHQVDIASSEMDSISDEYKKMGVNSYELSVSRSLFNKGNIKVYSEIREIYLKNKYDVVHVHTPIIAFITRMALRNENVKLIYTAHGFHFYKGAPLINWIIYYPAEKIAARWTDVIATINKEDFERAKKFKLKANGKVVLTNGVGVETKSLENPDQTRNNKRAELGIKDDEFVLLVLAEINKNKNHIQLIKAIELMGDERCKKLKVVCAGDGPLENELHSYIEKNGLTEKVKFIGWRRDIRELIEASDAVGLFSYREGLPKCIMEGMIYGKPLIVTASRGALGLVEDGINGFVVEINDIKGTADKLEKLYEKEDIRKEFINNGLIKGNRYLMESILDEIVNLNTK